MPNQYSFKKNIIYMAQAFYQPRLVITRLPQETSPLYSIIPFTIYIIVGEANNFIAAVRGYSLQDSSNPFPKVLLIQNVDSFYARFILFPLLSILALGIFAAVVHILSRLRWFRGVSALKCTLFLMFLSTIGIVILICEAPWMPAILRFYAPPVGGLLSILYLDAFIHEQANISRMKSLAMSILSLAFYFVFRGLVMR